MADIAVSWDAAYNRADWTVAGASLLVGDTIVSQVLISIFSDRMAAPDDKIPDGTGDPRGWWGDSGEDVPIGSRIWLLRRAKQTQETLQAARDYIAEALQWMIDDKVLARFDIRVEWTRRTFLGASLVAYQFDGTAIPINAVWPMEGSQ